MTQISLQNLKLIRDVAKCRGHILVPFIIVARWALDTKVLLENLLEGMRDSFGNAERQTSTNIIGSLREQLKCLCDRLSIC